MFCSNCGKELDNNAAACPACGAATMRVPNPAPPPNPASAFNSAPNPQSVSSAPMPGYTAQTHPTPVPAAVQMVPNHLVGAILATCCCCLPFGIVSIVYASSVDSKMAAGDIAGARAASNNAQTWMWLAFGVGIVVILITIFCSVIPALVSILPFLSLFA